MTANARNLGSSSLHVIVTYLSDDLRDYRTGVTQMDLSSGSIKSFALAPQRQGKWSASPAVREGAQARSQLRDYGCLRTILAQGTTPATVGVTGSNTAYAKWGFKHTSGGSSKFGWASKVGSGAWFEASGSYEHRVSSSASETWNLRQATGTYSLRKPVWTQYTRTRCSGGHGCRNGCPDRYAERPTGFTAGGYSPAKWRRAQRPTWCVPLASGNDTVIDFGSMTKWNNGLKLGADGMIGSSINVHAETAASAATSYFYQATRGGQFLCGKDGVPGRDRNIGLIMADSVDR